MTEQLPHDLDAERSLLGWLLTKPSAIDSVREQVLASMFYRPAHGELFGLLCALRDEGLAVDMILVAAEVRRKGIPLGEAELVGILGAAMPNVDNSARVIAECACWRQAIGAGSELIAMGRAAQLHPDDLVDAVRDVVGRIIAPRTGRKLADVWTVDEFLALEAARPTPWIIPGLMREGWRCMVVATEGAGKSVMARLIAVAAAQGVHPFAHTAIPPVRTLVVDLENSRDAIRETLEPINDQAKRVGDYDTNRPHIWSRPGGINLRTREGRGDFEQAIMDTRPDLVCLGPVYKAYTTSAREHDEQAAGEVQRVLDDLRTRYRFALLLEHHAPKAQGPLRDLLPYGSSLWLRWPELGLKLTPAKAKDAPKGSLDVGRWRVDRVSNAWPDRLDRGAKGSWPIDGYWVNPPEDFIAGALPAQPVLEPGF